MIGFWGALYYTRLTNSFSKIVENLEAAVTLYFMNYNFCRPHPHFKTTPAIAADIIRDIAKMLESSK